jgi:hypothetical protein
MVEIVIATLPMWTVSKREYALVRSFVDMVM